MTINSQITLFNPLDFPLGLSQPQRLTNVTSWHEHIPFSFALMEMVRPRVFVELGTHQGDSYCGFCQAVDTLGASTRCYAVDTWEGDSQAGIYGEEVLGELRSYHDPLYGRFSRLIQSTFDDAVSHFPDNSIDLLHIDGMHTYEAVKHDFKTWLPKLSDRSIVLFHDTNVRERDFGVWKLWRELQRSYPSFEFPHGNGLGILGVGKRMNPEVAKLFSLDEQARELACAFFFRLGGHLTKEDQLRDLNLLIADQAAETKRYKGHAVNLEEIIINLKHDAENRETIIENNMHHAEELEAVIENCQLVEANQGRIIDEFKRHVENFEEIISNLKRETERQATSIANLKHDTEKQALVIENCRQQEMEQKRVIDELKRHVANQEKTIAGQTGHIAHLNATVIGMEQTLMERDAQIALLQAFEGRVKGTLLYKTYKSFMAHKAHYRGNSRVAQTRNNGICSLK